jgi:hypothetical protein
MKLVVVHDSDDEGNSVDSSEQTGQTDGDGDDDAMPASRRRIKGSGNFPFPE